HYARALAHERGHLVAQGLAGPRGHEHERVPAAHERLDDLGLVPAEVRVPPDPAQHVAGGLGHAPTLTAPSYARRRPRPLAWGPRRAAPSSAPLTGPLSRAPRSPRAAPARAGASRTARRRERPPGRAGTRGRTRAR